MLWFDISQTPETHKSCLFTFFCYSWAEERGEKLPKGSRVEIKTGRKYSKGKTDSNVNVQNKLIISKVR